MGRQRRVTQRGRRKGGTYIVLQRHIMREHHLLPHDGRLPRVLERLVGVLGEHVQPVLERRVVLLEVVLGGGVVDVAVEVELVPAGREVL